MTYVNRETSIVNLVDGTQIVRMAWMNEIFLFICNYLENPNNLRSIIRTN